MVFNCMRKSLTLSTEIFEELAKHIKDKLPESRAELTNLVARKKAFDKRSRKLISKLEDLYIILV